jgi:hypothetical protein
MTGSNRRTIFVKLNFSDATPTVPTSEPALDRRNKMFLQGRNDLPGWTATPATVKRITVSVVPDLLRVGPIRGSITITTNDPEFPQVVVPAEGAILGPSR